MKQDGTLEFGEFRIGLEFGADVVDGEFKYGGFKYGGVLKEPSASGFSSSPLTERREEFAREVASLVERTIRKHYELDPVLKEEK